MNYKALVEHGFEKRVKVLRKGLATQLPTGQAFAQTGGPLAVSDAIARLDAYLALGAAADTAERAAQTARQQLLAATPAMYNLTENLRTLVRGYLGAAHPALEQFGIPPKKRRKLKMVEEAAAGVRRAETRKIRGTLGPKQRLKLRAPKVAVGQAPASKPKSGE